ncbi:MAG: hypothetical protein KAS72_15735 [Phycisphaerales bacterium]|nr:hypothetical protein [Phycisphaerales bacterium]
MIYQLIVIALVLLIAYWWAGQGALSALLHLACVIAAGAIAFAVWEIVTIKLLFPAHEFFESTGWAIGLLLPFTLALTILRVACDKLIGANLSFQPNIDFTAGAVLGAASGILTAGILVIGLGFLQLQPKFFGYLPIVTNDGSAMGSLKRDSKLWLGVDRYTEAFYNLVSNGAFASSHPLNEYQAQLADEANLIRMNFEGMSRNSMQPGVAKVASMIKVTGNLPALYRFAADDAATYHYEDPWNGRPDPGASIYLLTIEFESETREKTGGMAVGNAQFRLVVEDDETGTYTSVVPMAIIGKAEPDPRIPGDHLGRWRFEAADEFRGTAGGGATATMAFEFIVPPRHTPRYLSARHLRLDLPDVSGEMTAAERNAGIAEGTLFSASGRKFVEPSQFNTANMRRVMINRSRDDVIHVSARFPGQWALTRDQLSSLKVNDDRQVYDGEQTFTEEDLTRRPGRTLAINSFQERPGTRIVKVVVDMTPDNPLALPASVRGTDANSQIPLLIDRNGQQYVAKGYIYVDRSQVTFAYATGRTIKLISELPSLSRNQPDRKLTLLFEVTAGVTLTRMSYGPDVRGEFTVNVRN